MAVFWFCCSVGDPLPIRGLLYDYVPPTRHFRNPGWFREYAMLCVAVLATLGITDLHDAIRTAGSKTWRKCAVAATLVSGAAIVSYGHVAKKVQVQRSRRRSENKNGASHFISINEPESDELLRKIQSQQESETVRTGTHIAV